LTVLIVVFMGELIGVNVIVGAFIAGTGLARVAAVRHNRWALHKRLERIGYGLIIPFLFLSIGMKTDLGAFRSASDSLMLVVLTIGGLTGSKIASGWLAMRLAGFTNAKGLCAGLMTVPQLTATLAAATVGYELNMIDHRFLNAIVILSIVTTIPVPTLVKFLIDKLGIRFDTADDSITTAVSEVEEELI